MKEKWPNWISNTGKDGKGENAEFIDKIKLEYIQSAKVEGDDLYYEYLSTKWFMTMRLKIGEQSSHAFIWGRENYKKFEDMIVKSGEFECADYQGLQLRMYEYTRKGQGRSIDEHAWDLLNDNNPTLARLWKAAAETFPDGVLRNYFVDYGNFKKFYDKMNEHYKGEETRFYEIFDICPELKEIAEDTSQDAEREIDFWAGQVKWNEL